MSFRTLLVRQKYNSWITFLLILIPIAAGMTAIQIRILNHAQEIQAETVIQSVRTSLKIYALEQVLISGAMQFPPDSISCLFNNIYMETPENWHYTPWSADDTHPGYIVHMSSNLSARYIYQCSGGDHYFLAETIEIPELRQQ